MIKQNQKSKKDQESLLKTANKINKSVVVGSIIATLIAITPFLFSLHESVPQTKVWDTFLFTYDSNLWEDANYAMWVFTGKFIPLILLIIWFVTCRHWWYHALLVPIVMYIFQIVGTYNGDTQNIDEYQFIYLLPVMAIVVPSIYLIRVRIFNKINDADKTMQELEDEFKIKPKGILGKLKDYF
ncbi:hypothetical protein [Gaetbulibacter sp. NE]|uniref:hypothetical protein n=1 Tax=Gaetbulibacter sp. NE TaxID=2982307 RepID=UPI0021CEB844|nr:hypothetical protein [Gaetbulibacter sp. NE]